MIPLLNSLSDPKILRGESLLALTGFSSSFCCFFIFSMISNTCIGIWNIQGIIFRVCYVVIAIDRIFSIVYKQYVENFPAIQTVMPIGDINEYG